jgi:hypothetical protein
VSWWCQAVPPITGPFDFRHGGELARVAYERTRRWLEEDRTTEPADHAGG